MRNCLPGKRVLVVEDDALLAYDIDDMLRGEGAEVVGPAHDLPTAILLARDCALDGAILDIDLCGEFVWPVASELRDHSVPFVFVSAECCEDVPDDFRGAAFLSKPAPAEAIIGKVAEVISTR